MRRIATALTIFHIFVLLPFVAVHSEEIGIDRLIEIRDSFPEAPSDEQFSEMRSRIYEIVHYRSDMRYDFAITKIRLFTCFVHSLLKLSDISLGEECENNRDLREKAFNSILYEGVTRRSSNTLRSRMLLILLVEKLLNDADKLLEPSDAIAVAIAFEKLLISAEKPVMIEPYPTCLEYVQNAFQALDDRFMYRDKWKQLVANERSKFEAEIEGKDKSQALVLLRSRMDREVIYPIEFCALLGWLDDNLGDYLKTEIPETLTEGMLQRGQIKEIALIPLVETYVGDELLGDMLQNYTPPTKETRQHVFTKKLPYSTYVCFHVFITHIRAAMIRGNFSTGDLERIAVFKFGTELKFHPDSLKKMLDSLYAYYNEQHLEYMRREIRNGPNIELVEEGEIGPAWFYGSKCAEFGKKDSIDIETDLLCPIVITTNAVRDLALSSIFNDKDLSTFKQLLGRHHWFKWNQYICLNNEEPPRLNVETRIGKQLQYDLTEPILTEFFKSSWIFHAMTTMCIRGDSPEELVKQCDLMVVYKSEKSKYEIYKVIWSMQDGEPRYWAFCMTFITPIVENGNLTPSISVFPKKVSLWPTKLGLSKGIIYAWHGDSVLKENPLVQEHALQYAEKVYAENQKRKKERQEKLNEQKEQP